MNWDGRPLPVFLAFGLAAGKGEGDERGRKRWSRLARRERLCPLLPPSSVLCLLRGRWRPLISVSLPRQVREHCLFCTPQCFGCELTQISAPVFLRVGLLYLCLPEGFTHQSSLSSSLTSSSSSRPAADRVHGPTIHLALSYRPSSPPLPGRGS